MKHQVSAQVKEATVMSVFSSPLFISVYSSHRVFNMQAKQKKVRAYMVSSISLGQEGNRDYE